MMHYGMEGWGFGWLWLLWLIVLAAVVAMLVAAFLRASNRDRTERADGESAEELVRKRYARGEIDKEQYHDLLADLRR